MTAFFCGLLLTFNRVQLLITISINHVKLFFFWIQKVIFILLLKNYFNLLNYLLIDFAHVIKNMKKNKLK